MSDCVQSGFCCTVRPCQYGTMAPGSTVCVYLQPPTRIGQRACGLYHVIRILERHQQWPMMGSGCSSPLCNDARNNVIAALRQRDG